MARRPVRLLAALLAAALAATAAANKPPPPVLPDSVPTAVGTTVRNIAVAIDGVQTPFDPAVDSARAPSRAKAEEAFTQASVFLEGPVKSATKPAYDAGSAVVTTKVRFWEGPFYNVSGPLRKAVGDKIVGIAHSLEGDEANWTTTPDPSTNFIPPVARVFGRKALTPGAGRLASIGIFGLVPKPPPRDVNEPRRADDPIWPSDLSDDPTGAPSGGFVLCVGCVCVDCVCWPCSLGKYCTEPSANCNSAAQCTRVFLPALAHAHSHHAPQAPASPLRSPLSTRMSWTTAKLCASCRRSE